MVVAACTGDDEQSLVLSDDLGPFTTDVIDLGGVAWTVAVADTPAERFRGLRGVRDLGDLDGMLFVFDTTSSSAFTMRDTLMPIDIAFFDSTGELVDRLEMVPCNSEPCPRYRASGSFRYALETDAGGFDGLGELTLSP
jgi:uncharacterized membrane protein (UPF0127 family)